MLSVHGRNSATHNLQYINDLRVYVLQSEAPPHAGHRHRSWSFLHLSNTVQGAAANIGRGNSFQEERDVKPSFAIIPSLALMVAFALPGLGQSNPDQNSTTTQKNAHTKKRASGPGKEIGHGGEDIGKGAAKGTGDLAKGAVGGVGNLATGHGVGAAASVGKGVGGFGKNVGVGTGKGVGKIGKGTGGELKKLVKKSKKKDEKGQ